MKTILSLYLFCGVILSAAAQNTMDDAQKNLLLAESKTIALFKAVESRGLIIAGKSEKTLVEEIVKIAHDEFGMNDHWHKKIVRAGINTLESYSKNPADRIIQKDDIIVLDFGPNYNGWETDVGRTYVLGSDPAKLKMKKDVEAASNEAKAWYAKQTKLTGAEFWDYLVNLAKKYGYEFGGEIGGHIIGKFPHEQPEQKGSLSLDVHPDNHESILSLDKNGNKRQWMLEIQFNNKEKGFGGFYEQRLN